MKSPLPLFATAVVILISFSRGDGFRFDPETQKVSVDSLRVLMDNEQIEILCKTGNVTLNDSQLSLIRSFYPSAQSIQQVIAATFNDNVEREEECVDIYWVGRDELAVTLIPEIISSAEKSKNALAEPFAGRQPDPNQFRLSPDGRIFHLGKQISEEQAFVVMAKHASVAGSGDVPEIRVVVPPPGRNRGEEADGLKAEKTFERLRVCGKDRGVMVLKGW